MPEPTSGPSENPNGETNERKEAKPSERLQRRRAIARGEAREKGIFDRALREFLSQGEIAKSSADPSSIERELRDRREAILETIAPDRATFREAVVELDAARRRENELLRILFPAFLGICLLFFIGAIMTTFFSGLSQVNSLLVSTLVALATASVARTGSTVREYIAARETLRRARRDAYAAETLLFGAIVETGLPDQLRQIRHGIRASEEQPADAPPPDPPVDGEDPAHITPFSAEHLVEVYREGQQIPTGARARLEALTTTLKGASLGIAGPRGAGKTTLLRWFFANQASKFDHLALQIAAPVRYDPRDFVLTLFARLCEEVMGPQKAPLLPHRRSLLSSEWTTATGLILVVIGGLVFTTDMNTPHFLETARGLAGTGLIASGILVLTVRYLRGARESVEGPSDLTLPSILEEGATKTAPRLWRDIRFQLTYSTGYSGKLTAGFGELGADSSYSLAARQESFPEIVGRLQAFLEAIVKEREQAYIAIDELDKLPVGDAVRFLDDVKGLFGVPGCFFFVSISEDALGQFERRGLPMRDTFDSTFDEVLRVDPLRVDESLNLLGRRAEGVDPRLGVLCHILAGGIPRDVIRHARHLAAIAEKGPTLIEAADELMYRDLRERASGMQLALSGAATDPAVEDWLGEFEDASFEALFGLAEFGQASGPAAENGNPTGAGPEITSSSTATSHLACLAYLGDTALSLLRQENERGQSLLEGEANTLGLARLRIGNSPRQAKALCDEVRARFDLPSIPSDFTPPAAPSPTGEPLLRRLLRGEMPL